MFVTVRARVYADATGAYAELPALLTPEGVLEPLVDYFLARSHDRSLMWMHKVVRSVRMFLEYLNSNPAERDTYLLFRNFAQRLYTGTFDPKSGLDPSELAWPARSSTDAATIVGHLTDFFEWLGQVRPAAAKVNPRYVGGAFDKQCDDAAYQFKRDQAFLGHTWAANVAAEGLGHMTRAQRAPRVAKGEPPSFPEDRFEELIFKGFKVGDRYDWRNMLITLLLHGAGFRESEPFHLYIGDVCPDPANPRQALVRIHHPSQGQAPADWLNEQGKPRKGNRTAYLAEQFGLVPRTQMQGSRHAGWKGGLHDGPYFKQAHWFQPQYGEWFLQLWHRYLREVAFLDRDHPFAFANLVREPRGSMYCLPQYNKAHAAACERIGLQVAKSLGTTPHGHRHAYGRRLMRAGIEKALIRRFMHHSSLDSQDVYTQATTSEMLAELAAASTRLRAALPAPSGLPSILLTDELTY